MHLCYCFSNIFLATIIIIIVPHCHVSINGDLYRESAGGVAEVGTGEGQRTATLLHQTADKGGVWDPESHQRESRVEGRV